MKRFFLATAIVAVFATSLTALSTAGSKKMSIYKTAEAAEFTTLVAAINAAGLEETLSKEGPFTVFAPTDEAFAKLPEGTVESLLEDKEALTNVLMYHVVSGDITSDKVVKLKKAEMLNGQEATITAEKNVVEINDAKVVKVDIAATNGVIHVIDTVLLPPTMTGEGASK